MPYQNVSIFGATGNVGSELTHQIVDLDQENRGHINPTRIVGLANKYDGYYLDAKGIKEAAQIVSVRSEFAYGAERYSDLKDVIKKACDWLDGDVVFVDATADSSETMREIHRYIIDSRLKIVTANKNPIALCSAEEFDYLTKHRDQYGYNAAVMAGGDAVPFLQDSYDISDPVYRIEGCFSGTLGYVCSELEKGRLFSEIVKEAKELKYTEPHPWDDLSGLDVARKLCILARSAGYRIEFEDIQIESFIPKEYQDIKNTNDFMQSLHLLNEDFAKRVSSAAKQKKVLRYVASLEKTSNGPLLSVGLKEVDRNSPIGSLQGTSNIVAITTKLRAPENDPHVIRSKGAGLEKTAAAIRADLLKFLPGRKANGRDLNHLA